MEEYMKSTGVDVCMRLWVPMHVYTGCVYTLVLGVHPALFV